MKTKSSERTSSTLPVFIVLVGNCLGYKVYRGFAPLWQLAEISRADMFDQEKNPTGTQRNLSRTHARKAYDYVANEDRAFYPEVIMNVRDSTYIRYSEYEECGQPGFGTLEFIKDPRHSRNVVISRLDGNHRLWFVDGHEKSMKAIDRPASFCILTVSDINKELAIFRDINDNQMGMNTSHLQNITARLLGKKALKATDPALYIVQKLHQDPESPFHDRIHQGGAIQRGTALGGLNTASLKNAVKDMLTRSTKISQFPDVDAQYELIKNFWVAMKLWLPEAWEHPNDYIIFKGVGLYATTYLGIEIADRCLLKAKYSAVDMLEYLKKIPNPTEALSSKGGIPYAGRAGGRKLASDLIAELEDEGELSLQKLQKLILGEQ
jgi:DGQHR domain-containing protein